MNDAYKDLKVEVTSIILRAIPSRRIFKMVIGMTAEELAGRIAKVSKKYLDARLELIEERLDKLEEKK